MSPRQALTIAQPLDPPLSGWHALTEGGERCTLSAEAAAGRPLVPGQRVLARLDEAGRAHDITLPTSPLAPGAGSWERSGQP